MASDLSPGYAHGAMKCASSSFWDETHASDVSGARVEQVVEHAHALGAVPLGRAGVDRARGGRASAERRAGERESTRG